MCSIIFSMGSQRDSRPLTNGCQTPIHSALPRTRPQTPRWPGLAAGSGFAERLRSVDAAGDVLGNEGGFVHILTQEEERAAQIVVAQQLFGAPHSSGRGAPGNVLPGETPRQPAALNVSLEPWRASQGNHRLLPEHSEHRGGADGPT
jgi:hypothetical protein